jgi:hypothetical protein
MWFVDSSKKYFEEHLDQNFLWNPPPQSYGTSFDIT